MHFFCVHLTYTYRAWDIDCSWEYTLKKKQFGRLANSSNGLVLVYSPSIEEPQKKYVHLYRSMCHVVALARKLEDISRNLLCWWKFLGTFCVGEYFNTAVHGPGMF